MNTITDIELNQIMTHLEHATNPETWDTVTPVNRAIQLLASIKTRKDAVLYGTH